MRDYEASCGLTWSALGQRHVMLGEMSCCPGSGGHSALDGADLPYCATCTEMDVPCGHFKVTTSSSQPALWYVLSVPDNRAAVVGDRRIAKKRNRPRRNKS